MSDDDPFSYKPLRVSKRRKKMPEKRRKGKSQSVDIKEEEKEGIVEIFAGTKIRPSLVETPTGGIFIVPWNWHFIKALT